MSEEEKKILKTFKTEVEREQKDYSRVNSYTQFLYDNRKAVLELIEKQDKELETYKKIAERYERECRMFRAFCRKIRKDEKRNVDEFNQGREYAYIQFLNLIGGEQNWEHEGKYFDEVDQELEKWARKEVENE